MLSKTRPDSFQPKRGMDKEIMGKQKLKNYGTKEHPVLAPEVEGFEVGRTHLFPIEGNTAKTVKRVITSIENGVVVFECLPPLLFNQKQRDVINYHPSKLTEWYIYYTVLRVWRWLR